MMQILQVVVLLLLLSLPSPINAQRSACKVEYTKVICPMATLYYSVGEYNGKTVFCGRLEVNNGGTGWVALGVSSLGGSQSMGGSGSVAIIGNPMDGSVKVYDLYSIPSNGIVEIDSNTIALLESSTKVTGTKTIMEFTKYEEQQLIDDDDDSRYASFVNPANYILHARGMSNTIGYHGKDRFSFKIDLPPTSTSTTTTSTTTSTSTTATTAMTTTTSTKAAATTTTTTTTTVANNRPPIRKPTITKPEKIKPSKMNRPRPTKKRPKNNIKPTKNDNNNNNNNNNKPTKKNKKKKPMRKKTNKKKPKKKKERQPRLIFN
jgi:hypothetical protein